MNSLSKITVKNIGELKKLIKEYTFLHVLGSTSSISDDIRCVVDMHKLKDYTQVFHSLHFLHVGLANTLERSLSLVDENVLPSLFEECIRRVCGVSTLHTKTLRSCLYSHQWSLLHLFLRLTESHILLVNAHNAEWHKVSEVFEKYGDNLNKDIHIPHELVSVAVQIPSYQKTYYVLESNSYFGDTYVAMGLIEISEMNKIERISFLYSYQDKVYRLTNNDMRVLLGKRYPVQNYNDMNDLWTRIHMYFSELPDMHISNIIEALVKLINKSFS